MTNNKTLLEIKNLNASVADTQILKDFNLTINIGEKHTIMGTKRIRKEYIGKYFSWES